MSHFLPSHHPIFLSRLHLFSTSGSLLYCHFFGRYTFLFVDSSRPFNNNKKRRKAKERLWPSILPGIFFFAFMHLRSVTLSLITPSSVLKLPSLPYYKHILFFTSFLLCKAVVFVVYFFFFFWGGALFSQI